MIRPACLALLPLVLVAQSPDPTFTLSGRVKGFQAVPGKSATLVFTRTDAPGSLRVPLTDGTYKATLPGGHYRLAVEGTTLPLITAQREQIIQAHRTLFHLQLAAEPTPAPQVVQDWIRTKAIPLSTVEAGHGFKDMLPLRSLIGDATVVALGEATHGTREFFQLKHRMLEFLVEEMGFTVFAIEANLPEAFAVDHYILTGEGDPAKALAGLYFWTWNTEEVLGMIRWMRAYNADPAHTHKVRFYGVDMQTDTVALKEAQAWLDKVAPSDGSRLRTLMSGIPRSKGNALTEAELAILRERLAGMEALFTAVEARKETLARATDTDTCDRQLRNLRVVVQCLEMNTQPQNYAIRDRCMAENLRWIQTREKGARVALWAHNGHISTESGVMAGAQSMGWHLRQALGQAYRPVGFAFRQGGFQAVAPQSGLTEFAVSPQSTGTLDEALASAGQPRLALDLRSLPAEGPVRDWFHSPQRTWSIGAMFSKGMETAYIHQGRVTEGYDALLFVERTTAALPVGGRKSAKGAPVTTTAARGPINLDFESLNADGKPSGWWVPPSESFRASVVSTGAQSGTHCMEVRPVSQETAQNEWYSVMQAIDATPYRSRKVRLSGWVRTEGDANRSASLWLRVDREQGRLGFFDNMNDRPVKATTWTHAIIEGDVAEDATVLNLGGLILGNTTAWFDSFKLEVIGDAASKG